MTLKKVIWLGPAVFLLHDLEEVIFTQWWIEKNDSLIKDNVMLQKLVDNFGYSPHEFGLVVGMMTILYLIISYFAASRLKPGLAMDFFRATLLILFVNVFTHAAQSFIFQMYTPGVVTALTIVLPYTSFAFKKLKREQTLGTQSSTRSTFLAIGTVPVIFGMLFLVRYLLNTKF